MNFAFTYGLNLPVYVAKTKPEFKNQNEGNRETNKKNKLYPLSEYGLKRLLEKERININTTEEEFIERIFLTLERRLNPTIKTMEQALKKSKRPTHGHFLILAVALNHPSKKIYEKVEQKLSVFVKTSEHAHTLLSFAKRLSPEGRIPNLPQQLIEKSKYYKPQGKNDRANKTTLPQAV